MSEDPDFDVCIIAAERFSSDENSPLCPKVGLCGHSFSACGLLAWADARKTDEYNKLKKLLPCVYKCARRKDNELDIIKAFRPTRLITNVSLCQALKVIQKCRSHGSQEPVEQWDFDKCSLCAQDFFVNSKKCTGSKEYHPKAPIVGVCGHTFCSGCLYSLHAEALASSFSDNLKNVKCPKCNEKNAFHIENLIDNITFRGAIRFWKSLAEKKDFDKARPVNTATRGREESLFSLENHNADVDVEISASNLCAEAAIKRAPRVHRPPEPNEVVSKEMALDIYNLGQKYTMRETAAAEKRAIRYYRQAANAGSDKAQHTMGILYQCGGKHSDLKKSYRLALKFFQLAADQGYADSQLALAKLLYRQNLELEKAARYCKSALENGNTEACTLLALMFEFGKGVQQNTAESLRLLQQGAQGGDIDAQQMLAALYKSNKETSFAIHKMAADNGDALSQLEVGMLLEEGCGKVKCKLTQALQYYEASAKQGVLKAQLALGRIFKKDSLDLEKSAHYFRLAADRGDHHAQLNLALLLEQSEADETSLREAAYYFKKAAGQGSPEAQFRFGLMCALGKGGLPIDHFKAQKYFQLAADNGYGTR